MRSRLPLVLLPIVLALLSSGPAHADAVDRLLQAMPSPQASPAPTPEPTGTPTPSGPFFDNFYHSRGDEGSATVDLEIHGQFPGSPKVSIVWTATTGKLVPGENGSVEWQGPPGKRNAPLEVPLTATLTDGRLTLTGRVTVTVDKEGDATVTAMDLPGLHGNPEQFTGCFEAGTPVRLADGGVKPIEQLHVGDRVQAYDLDGARAADASVELLLVHRDHPARLSQLRTADGHELHVTGNHPLMRPDGSWTPVARLNPGDQVMVFDGGAFHAVKIAALVRDWREAAVVYNLKTTRHDYVAAEVLVHNKCLAAGTLVDTPHGATPIEALKPGDTVLDAHGQPTRVTHAYAKRTMAPALPGKRLAPGILATVNHLVWDGGRFVPAGTLPGEEVPIAGTVYDLQTAAGSYRAGGLGMTAQLGSTTWTSSRNMPLLDAEPALTVPTKRSSASPPA